MIQDIVPHRYDNTYKIQTPHAQDILLYYQKQDVLCQHTEQGDTLPRFELFADEVKEKAQYLFSIDDVGFGKAAGNSGGQRAFYAADKGVPQF